MSQDSLRLTVHIDGGARGNPGPAAAAYVARDAADDAVVGEAGLFLGKATNNAAEYRALLAALECAGALKAAEVEIRSDSELLVRQMNGQYRVKNARLRPLFEQAQALASQFQRFTVRHIRREENAEADRLVQRAINVRRDVCGADDE
jgi:ribonuclease HI